MYAGSRALTGTGGRSGGYVYSQRPLHFTEDETAANGKKTAYVYTGYASGDQVDRFAVCFIPATTAAVEAMHQRFGFRADPGNQDAVSSLVASEGEATASLEQEPDPITVDPITVTVCQYGGVYPDCDEPPPPPPGGSGDEDDDGYPGDDCCTGGSGGDSSLPGDYDGDGDAYDDGPVAYAICMLAMLNATSDAYAVSAEATIFHDTIQEYNTALRELQMLQDAENVEYAVLYYARMRVEDLETQYRNQAIMLSNSVRKSLFEIGMSAASCTLVMVLPTL